MACDADVMTEKELTELFRIALRVSLAAPLLAGAVACGSSSTTGATGTDAGKTADAEKSHADVSSAPIFFDSGNACKPTLPACSSGTIPLTCFDGGLTEAGAELNVQTCAGLCGTSVGTCSVEHDAGPGALFCSTPCRAIGRGFAGMAPLRTRGQRSALGRYFAMAAQLEAASIDAFLILRDELAAHAAPAALVEAAETAAADEVRHARRTRGIARRFGSCPMPRRAPKRPTRALEAVAVENAVEGCVRETFGALVAHHQAEAAGDPQVRQLMSTIADDETRHAALGWAVARWAEEQLDDAGRDRVRAARREAVEKLRAEVVQRVPASLILIAGLPDAGSASRMLAVLQTTLWS